MTTPDRTESVVGDLRSVADEVVPGALEGKVKQLQSVVAELFYSGMDRAGGRTRGTPQEAQLVWHKWRGTVFPGDWYVSLTGDTFVAFMQLLEKG
jgi:hypothetical protein